MKLYFMPQRIFVGAVQPSEENTHLYSRTFRSSISSLIARELCPQLSWLVINCKFRFRYGVLRRDSNAFYN